MNFSYEDFFQLGDVNGWFFGANILGTFFIGFSNNPTCRIENNPQRGQNIACVYHIVWIFFQKTNIIELQTKFRPGYIIKSNFYNKKLKFNIKNHGYNNPILAIIHLSTLEY